MSLLPFNTQKVVFGLMVQVTEVLTQTTITLQNIIAQQLLVEKLVHLIRDMLMLEGLLVHGFVLLGERKLHSTIMFRMV